MHLRVSLSVALAVGSVACADRAPTAVEPTGLAPTASPSFDKLESSTPVAGARLVLGNLSGNGAAICNNAAVNTSGRTWLGNKVDGANGSTIPGYAFTVSADGRFVSYQPVGGAQQYVITAVVVKGGPNTFVYAPPLAAGQGMRAPDNGGGNIPQISHYTVCYEQGPGYTWQVKKALTEVYGGTLQNMIKLGVGQPVVIPQGETRWLEFHITVTRAGGPGAGGTATLQDIAAQACATLPAGFACELPKEYSPTGVMANYTYPTVTGSGTFHFMIDVYNTGAACGTGGTITNIARLTPAGGSPQESSVLVQVAAPPCWTMSKQLTEVYGGTLQNMIKLGVGQPVVIAVGETRWLEFHTILTAGTGAPPATLHDLAAQACATLPAGFKCELPKEYSPTGVMANYTYPGPITGSGSFHFMIDVYNTGAACGAQGTVTNIARLTSGSSVDAPTLTADAQRVVTIRAQACL